MRIEKLVRGIVKALNTKGFNGDCLARIRKKIRQRHNLVLIIHIRKSEDELALLFIT